jgi:hypothetical protein
VPAAALAERRQAGVRKRPARAAAAAYDGRMVAAAALRCRTLHAASGRAASAAARQTGA